TKRHARGMNHISRAKFSRSGDGRLADADRAVPVAFILHSWSRRAPDGAGDTATELQVVVRSVDYRVDGLFHQVAVDDHDVRLMTSQISPIRSFRSCRVAPAMPRTPLDSLVSDAQATPLTIATCRSPV